MTFILCIVSFVVGIVLNYFAMSWLAARGERIMREQMREEAMAEYGEDKLMNLNSLLHDDCDNDLEV